MTSHNPTDTKSSSSHEILDQQEDQAEKGLIESVERRRQPSDPRQDWQPAISGERPPLPHVPFKKLYSVMNSDNTLNTDTNEDSPSSPPPPPLPHQRRDSASITSRGNKSRGSINNNSTSRGSRSERSQLSRGRGNNSRHLSHAPNYAEIAQKLRRMSSARDIMANVESVSDGDGGGVGAESSASRLTPPSASQNTSSLTNHPNNNNYHGRTSSLTSHHQRHPSKAHALLEAIQERTYQPSGLETELEIENGASSQLRRRSSSIFEGIGAPGTSNDVGASSLAMEDSNTDQLITGAMQVERLFWSAEHEAAIQEEQEAELYPEVHTEEQILEPFAGDPKLLADNSGLDEVMNEEMQPLTSRQDGSYGTSPNEPITIETPNAPSRRNMIAQDRKAALKFRRQTKSAFWKDLLHYLDPRYLWAQLVHLAMSSLAFKLCMPLTCFSWIFFYYLGDPSPEFLPGKASISWWLLFIARQCLILDVARLAQWFFVDCIILNSRIAVRLLGPLPTLVVIQAKGWPFCAFAWALIDLFALHGTDHFQQHWLYWTGITLFSYGNTGVYLLNHQTYTRILLAGLVAGIATAAKRTFVALYFGHRTLVEFKPRLERILREVVVLSEVAELATEAEILEAAVNNTQPDSESNLPKKRHEASIVRWSPALDMNGRQRVFSIDRSAGRGDDDTASEDDAEDDSSNSDNDADSEAQQSFEANRYRSSSQSELIHLLDQWDEPKNVMDKTSGTSINDILKFRRALTFMDDDQPFGGSFGPAHNRENVIRSADNVFRRLLTLAPDNDALPFEALEMLAHVGDVDGPLDRSKLKAIKRMFRPDKDNLLSLIDFVKGCDGIYKKLRFFRASVGNASVIDHHLESIIDSIFYFVLILALLSVTGLNPWPLLVSISTLLVSISFAVGSSASKYIEGVLLIAVGRPFDLGDRIFMMNPSEINNDPGIMVSWFVEDINLFNSTVRYAGTNEVATINNGAIANMRIVNGNRSPNAVVWFYLPFRTRILREGRLDALKAFMEQYAKDHPRQWHSYSYCRFDTIIGEKDKLVATIGFQHRSSWQDLVGILTAKEELVCSILEYGRKHGINYEELPTRQLMYYAGQLKKGGYDEYRDSLHDPSNIINDDGADIDLGLRQRSPTIRESRSEGSDGLNATFLSNLQASHPIV